MRAVGSLTTVIVMAVDDTSAHGRRPSKRLLLVAAIDDPTWNRKGDHRPGIGGTFHGEFSNNAGRAFAHGLQPQVARFSTMNDFRVDTLAVIANAQGEIMRISRISRKSWASRIDACIADRRVADAIYLVAHDRMHFVSLARDVK